MGKPTAIVLHPKDWAVSEYGKKSSLHVVHVSIGGKIPRKKNGTPTYDGYAEMVTHEGVSDLEKAFRMYKPAYFLFWIHKGLNPQIIKTLKTISPKTKFLYWYGNHRHKFPNGVRQHLPNIDMVLINSKDIRQYKMYRSGGVPHVGTLWDGFNPNDVELSKDEPIYDCIFGGNSYLKRSSITPGLDFPGGLLRYNLIMEARKRFNVAVMSDAPQGWPFECLPAAYHPLYTNALRRAKINLNVNHFPTLEKAYTRRTIRSIFSGRMHVTLYIPGMEDEFENHKNIVWYDDLNEAMEIIKYYLENDKEREKIAAAQLKHACENFHFKNRLKDFEKIVKVFHGKA